MIYLDNAATKATLDIAKKAMELYQNKYYANPSSNYGFAERSKNVIEKTRKNIADILNVLPEEIYFTSGGTESDNWAIKNTALENVHRGNHIISSKIEHHAVLNSLKYLENNGFKVSYARVFENGRVDVNSIKRLTTDKTTLITCMMANNETGVIQPIEEIGSFTRDKNIVFHTDAVQTFTHIPIDCKKSNIDMLSASAHKFGGPKGVGFLYINNANKLLPYIHGGSQERGMRGGTSNVAGIAGMGAAAVESVKNMKEWNRKTKELRDYMALRLLKEIPFARINGDMENRLDNNLNLSFQYVDGFTLLELLDAKGICASGASACKSADKEPSHVLRAMGIPDEISKGTIRMTLSENNTIEEIEEVIEEIKRNVENLRKIH